MRGEVEKRTIYLGQLLKLNLDNVDHLQSTNVEPNDIIPSSKSYYVIPSSKSFGFVPRSEKLL